MQASKLHKKIAEEATKTTGVVRFLLPFAAVLGALIVYFYRVNRLSRAGELNIACDMTSAPGI